MQKAQRSNIVGKKILKFFIVGGVNE